MINTAIVTVESIEYTDADIVKFTAMLGNQLQKCINYNRLTGVLNVGDYVLLNTTAVDLGLGSGGYHFVTANLTRPVKKELDKGHIMKLKYTPMQLSLMTAEAPESQYHNIFNEFDSLEGFPVIIGSLHSMLAPCSVYMKSQKPEIKISYIMTDGGALPLYISDIVKSLKKDNVIEAAITYGNAFGGDFECINIYTALITAKEIVKADAAIVCMGPGITGTETKFGFSGTEQGQIIDAANRLGGFAIHIPRISFTDERERHYGISHHSMTVLKDICCTKANIAIPKLEDTKYIEIIEKQIEENGIKCLHNITYVDIDDVLNILKKKEDYLNKMGKGLLDDTEFFITCAAAGKFALSRLS